MPQAQLQQKPMRQKKAVASWAQPIPQLMRQLTKRAAPSMSSFREQQKLLNPAKIVPVKMRYNIRMVKG